MTSSSACTPTPDLNGRMRLKGRRAAVKTSKFQASSSSPTRLDAAKITSFSSHTPTADLNG